MGQGHDRRLAPVRWDHVADDTALVAQVRHLGGCLLVPGTEGDLLRASGRVSGGVRWTSNGRDAFKAASSRRVFSGSSSIGSTATGRARRVSTGRAAFKAQGRSVSSQLLLVRPETMRSSTSLR